MTESGTFGRASELGISIRSSRDASDAFVACLEHGGLLLTEAELCPEFFDLRTGLAGEVLQKFVSYRTPIAIVVARPDAHGGRFGELVREHRKHPVVRFFTSDEAAEAWLREPRPWLVVQRKRTGSNEP